MTRAGMGHIAPDIEVSGRALGPAVLGDLIDMKIQRSLGTPGRAVLTFVDEGFALSAGDTFELGAQVKVALATGTVLFVGEVTGLDLELERGLPEVSVVVDDRSYQMALGNRVETYLKHTYSEIIRKVCGRSGLRADIRITGDVQHEYVLQADSDLGFISELVERAAADWYLTDRTLVVRDESAQGPELTFGEDLRTFSVHASGLHPKSSASHGWAVETKREIVATATPGPAPASALAHAHVSAAKLSGAAAVVTARDNPASQREAALLAKGRKLAAERGAVTAKGSGAVNGDLELGAAVTVLNAGPASGTYRVTELQHVYTSRGFETRFRCGGGLPTGLVDTLAGPKVSSFRHPGLVIGVVTANDPTTSAARPGSIKVKYPAVSDEIESHWARVASVGAGNSRGLTFMPEINDEVLIGFEGGDLRSPVVLGGLYNGRDAASEWGRETDGRVAKRRITSRLGHYVEFGDGDTPGTKHVDVMLAGGKHRLRLGEDGITGEVPAGKPITLKAGQTQISIDESGNILLKGQKITIDGQQGVDIAGLTIAAKAQTTLELAAQVSAVLKAQAKVEMATAGTALISGTAVKVN